MKTLLYIRGEPGAGKITVARILAADLGWPLVWFHDFDFLRRFIDSEEILGNVAFTVLEGLLKAGKNVVYVRPSRTPQTVDRIRNLAERHGYRFVLVGLTAGYDELCARVAARTPQPYRIGTRAGLDEYLSRPEYHRFAGQHTLDTTGYTPEGVAKWIKELICTDGPPTS